MAFATLVELQNYINENIDTNGTNSITGAELNKALQGLAQFLTRTEEVGIASGEFTGILFADTLTASQTYALPDASGTIALTTGSGTKVYNGNYTSTLATNPTIITHDMPSTPVFATIVAKNAQTQTDLASGFLIEYTSTTLVIYCAGPFSGNNDFDWMAF